MSVPARPARAEGIRDVVAPVVADLGLDLEDLDVQPAGRRRRVCVIVDRDGGVDLDAIAATSRAVSDALDAADVMGEDAYVLEVTSPGIDRPLVLPRHWQRNIGRRVRTHLVDGAVIEGRLREIHDDGVVLAVDAGGVAESEEQRRAWAELARGEVQIEFRRPGNPEED